jgi:hypothetical protein
MVPAVSVPETPAVTDLVVGPSFVMTALCVFVFVHVFTSLRDGRSA